MFELNKKVKELKPYDPITGTHRIRLDANESYITPTAEMKEEISKIAVSAHFNRYPDPNATEVCEGFAKYFNVPSDCVMAGNGSDEVISVIMNAFLQKGDTVITFDKDFSMYSFYTSIVECRNIVADKNDDYSVNIDNIIKLANAENARMIVFSNPCNPTSKVISKDDVRRLVKGVNSLVILDEAYMDFSDQSLLPEFSEYDNLIILKTCSKAIGMAGIRLGFAVAVKTLTDVLKAVKSPYNVNLLSQAIGAYIFSQPHYIDTCINRIIDSRNDLYEHLLTLEKEFPNELSLTKPDTNFVFIKCARAASVFEYLKSTGIIVRLMGDHLRISAGRNYENEEVTNEMRKFFKGETNENSSN